MEVIWLCLKLMVLEIGVTPTFRGPGTARTIIKTSIPGVVIRRRSFSHRQKKPATSRVENFLVI